VCPAQCWPPARPDRRRPRRGLRDLPPRSNDPNLLVGTETSDDAGVYLLPDGSAMICTMQGDVWHVTGLDDKLDAVKWRRYASGLHQALGLVVAEGQVYVLGRDQITRLHDRNNDGEADYYERFSAAYKTSPGGHDYICGLQRDTQGRFYTASSNDPSRPISSFTAIRSA